LRLEASLGKYFSRPYLKKPFTKRVGRVVQGVGPEFKPQYHKKKKKKKKLGKGNTKGSMGVQGEFGG
jgi:hypothetical protein